MERVGIDSSNLRSVGYDDNNSILEVEFNYGGIYQYFDVPQNVYTGLFNAPSAGQFFDVNVKKAGYRYEKVN